MKEYQLYIDGSFTPGQLGATFESLNPHDESVVARCTRATSADAELAVRAARNAFDYGPWPRMSRQERSDLLKQLSDAINKEAAMLEQLEVDDAGGTIRKVKEDVWLSARAMNYFSKLAALDPTATIEGLSKPGFSKNLLLREPVGVVAAITPWNFPLKMSVWKLGPALAAGNTVILKPSELAPCSTLELARMADAIGFPRGVINVVTGYGPEVGEALVIHPGVDKVSFTGSTATGRRIMAMAAPTLKKCTLECGGKSANIVLSDADMDLAVDGSLYAAFYHQGQCCEAGTRLFLPAKLHDEFVSRMIATVGKMSVGDPHSPATDLGPLISAGQRDKVMGYISKGSAEGAKSVAGDKPMPKTGYYVAPTIFTGVHNDMTIATEEIFGPVLSVIRYENVEDAVRMANDTIYGLGAGVWSRDAEKAASVARQLRAGTVWINEWHLLSEKAPFGGYKQSGVGREFGLEGLYEYMEAKHLHIDEVGTRAKKTWYNTVIPQS